MAIHLFSSVFLFSHRLVAVAKAASACSIVILNYILIITRCDIT